jgi:hypothetical protein
MYWGYKCENCWSDTDILSCGSVVWQICTNISEHLLPPSSEWWRRQVPLSWHYISTGLQWLDQGDKQPHYHHLENLRSRFIWHSTRPWNLFRWCRDVAFDPLVSAAKGYTMLHFFFFPPILDSTEARAFLFCNCLEYCPRWEKKFASFSYVCFSGGSLHCFWCAWTFCECSKCIAETPSLSCVLFTFCIISLNFPRSKQWYGLFTSCNVPCMQAWHFRNFQIRASLCCPCHYT